MTDESVGGVMSTFEHIEAHDLPVALVALPPFPAVALKALRLMSCQDSRLRELHDLIRATRPSPAKSSAS